MAYSAIRLAAPVYRKYKGKNGTVEQAGYITTTANTVKFFGLDNIFNDSSTNLIISQRTVGKRTNQRAGGEETRAAAEGTSTDKSFVARRIPTGKGHKKLRIKTWDQIGEQAGSYHEVGFTIPRIIPNLGCQQIMGALLKDHISALPPDDVNAKKCRDTFCIDGRRYAIITTLPPETDRYYAGDILETETEITAVASASELLADMAEMITADPHNVCISAAIFKSL